MTDWNDITAAVATVLEGDPTGGAPRLRALWESSSPDEHAQRCVLAHYLAHLQPHLTEEVRWDELALEEFSSVHQDDLRPAGITSAAGMAPSLHLNLGDGYRRQGEIERAREQLHLGQTALAALTEDGYTTMIRKGLDRLRRRLDTNDPHSKS